MTIEFFILRPNPFGNQTTGKGARRNRYKGGRNDAQTIESAPDSRRRRHSQGLSIRLLNGALKFVHGGSNQH